MPSTHLSRCRSMMLGRAGTDSPTTTTKGRVIMGTSDKVWLKPGDEVVVEVGGLGRLVNRLIVPD